MIAGSWLGPRALARTSAARTMAGGLAALALGALLLLGISGHALELLGPFVAIGLGIGLAATASTAAGTQAGGEDRQGLASGLLNAAAQIGTSLGLALLVSIAAGEASGVGDYRRGFAGAALLAAAGAVALLAFGRRSSGGAAVRGRPAGFSARTGPPEVGEGRPGPRLPQTPERARTCAFLLHLAAVAPRTARRVRTTIDPGRHPTRAAALPGAHERRVRVQPHRPGTCTTTTREHHPWLR